MPTHTSTSPSKSRPNLTPPPSKPVALTPEAITSYTTSINCFLHLFSHALLAAGNHPPQSHEIAALKISNIPGWGRNIFLHPYIQGRIAIRTNIDIRRTDIPEFPPRIVEWDPYDERVSTMLVVYLVDIVPFIRRYNGGEEVEGGRMELLQTEYLFSDDG